jgi:hypothetical protein
MPPPHRPLKAKVREASVGRCEGFVRTRERGGFSSSRHHTHTQPLRPTPPPTQNPRSFFARVQAWLSAPAAKELGDASRGAVLAAVAAVIAAGAAVALYDRRKGVKEELEEATSTSPTGKVKAELSAARRDAKSSAEHVGRAAKKAFVG